MSPAIRYDFRSDTVTRPSCPTRAAMAAAVVGDDVCADDPIVSRLEATVCDTLGKESALLVWSGTQANLSALMSHRERGDAYIVGQKAHGYRWEAGGAAALASIQPQPLTSQPNGTLSLADIELAVKPDDPHLKGLGAPTGSVPVGSSLFISRERRSRRMPGGAPRRFRGRRQSRAHRRAGVR